VFIVTRQQKDGWEGDDYETNEIVPEKPAGQQAAATAALTLQVHMHKGCTMDAQGTLPPPVPEDMPGSTLPSAGNPLSLPPSGEGGLGKEAVES
jgi:hypothetical protein